MKANVKYLKNENESKPKSSRKKEGKNGIKIKEESESGMGKGGSRMVTLKKKLLGGLVGIHGAVLEHCVDFFIAVVTRDLF